jgi:hypothetical protein
VAAVPSGLSPAPLKKFSFRSLIPFLSFLQVRIPKIRLSSIPSSYPDRLASGNSTRLRLLSLSLMLRPMVSRPVCLGIKHPSGACAQIFYFHTEYEIRLTVTFLIPWGALSDERTCLSFVCTAGSFQRSLSRS